jgi:polysaccharide export outer membrane protein
MRGSRRNPFVKQDDLITVTNSLIGKTADTLKEITTPFIGIYTTKELIEDFNN